MKAETRNLDLERLGQLVDLSMYVQKFGDAQSGLVENRTGMVAGEVGVQTSVETMLLDIVLQWKRQPL